MCHDDRTPPWVAGDSTAAAGHALPERPRRAEPRRARPRARGHDRHRLLAAPRPAVVPSEELPMSSLSAAMPRAKLVRARAAEERLEVPIQHAVSAGCARRPSADLRTPGLRRLISTGLGLSDDH